MTKEETRLEDLRKTNPLFGPRKLKLGTFCTNVSGAATISTMEGVFEATWDNVRLTSRLADEMQFEAIVPLARWRGFGGDTDFNGAQFEALTFAAAVSAQTRYPSVFSTVQVPSIHPVLAAKQATTIDHVGGGRFTLNVVTGWSRRDVELFGAPLLEHDKRFVVADEWITLMKLLWTSDEPLDFEGRYFRVKDALQRPRPIQPYPALMNASSSSTGKRFAAKHFDVVFIPLRGRDPRSIKDQVESYRQFAREEYGRELKIWINSYMIAGDTQEDADRQFDYCVHEKGDWVAANNMIGELGITNPVSPAILKQMTIDFVAGWGGFKLVGTVNKIVSDLKMLVDAGIDGTLLTWPAFIDGMLRFQKEVHPLLIEEGLR
ncbi:MAG TPA: LLM class flavin-dependent oxidoreductase [Gemmataceae bacterium]|nr:LLM class flavin-dependent oxidoreductase [Gemmataceae bacterium]